MTDIHADAPAEDKTRPADRADIDRVDRRIDRVDVRIDRSEDRLAQAFAELKADIRAEFAKMQSSVDEVKKDVQALNKWKWAAAGAAGLAVIVVSSVLRFWPGG